jgi:hypothetical protein
MRWNNQIRSINRSLTTLTLWMNCTPVVDDDAMTEKGVDLAVHRESGPGKPERGYLWPSSRLSPKETRSATSAIFSKVPATMYLTGLSE